MIIFYEIIMLQHNNEKIQCVSLISPGQEIWTQNHNNPTSALQRRILRLKAVQYYWSPRDVFSLTHPRINIYFNERTFADKLLNFMGLAFTNATFDKMRDLCSRMVILKSYYRINFPFSQIFVFIEMFFNPFKRFSYGTFS